jgi:hypothetical protein
MQLCIREEYSLIILQIEFETAEGKKRKMLRGWNKIISQREF